MIHILDADEFNKTVNELPLIDVRSPVEYQKGHIPGAENIFLFDDDERALLGFLYVKKSPEEAIQKGMELANSRLERYIEAVNAIAPLKKVCIYCWRGGMRSNSFAELLSQNGFEVNLLKGGYKSYRSLLIEAFSVRAPLIVMGGMTGSGKTRILKELSGADVQIIDLENLAHHKGSVFGAMNQPEQPTTQQFENDLYEIWSRLDFKQPILVEDENYDIGTVKLPYALWQQMREAPMLEVRVSHEHRIAALVAEYAAQDDRLLASGILRIEKRLGSANAQRAMSAITEKNYRLATEILLDYYDKSYHASIEKRNAARVFVVDISDSQQSGRVKLLKSEILRIRTLTADTDY